MVLLANGQYGLMHPYAVNERTGEIVIPTASKIIDNSRFYDPQKDAGHIVCSGCAQAHLIQRKGHVSTGNVAKIRDHFATAHGETHGEDCKIASLGLHYPEDLRKIDINLAPYFYWNTEHIPPIYPHGGPLKHRASLPAQQHLYPEWAKAVTYGWNAQGFREIISAEFVRRARLNPAKSTADMLKILTTLGDREKDDTWVIVNEVAMRLYDTVIVERDTAAPRDLTLAPAIKKKANELWRRIHGKSEHDVYLPDQLMLPDDARYDFFAKQFFALRRGVRFPALINVQINTPPKYIRTPTGEGMIIELGKYRTENIDRTGLSLPTRTIERYVHVHDPSLFDAMKVGTEFFATTSPWAEKDERIDWLFYQAFNVLDVEMITMNDVVARMDKVRAARYRREAAKTVQKILPLTPAPAESIPA